jgi:hypothetical protein
MRSPSGVSLVVAVGLALGGAAHAVGQEREGDPRPFFLGDSAQDLVYTSVTPCRIINTRAPGAGGALAPGAPRDFHVTGTAGFDTQGGNAGGCGIPAGATAAMINFVAVNPAGAGNLRAWPFGQAAPTASIINYSASVNIANGVVVALCDPATATCGFDLTVRADASATQLVADVMGFFQLPANFIGTPGSQVFELTVNNLRTMRVESGAAAGFDQGPNVILGYGSNSVTAGVQGAMVGGGGVSGGGVFPNQVTGHFGTVSGGSGNQAGDTDGDPATGTHATVGGGVNNTASGLAATVAGGNSNTASGSAATAGGGAFNSASGGNAVVGGFRNTASGNNAAVPGGSDNFAGGDFGTVGGGSSNVASGFLATVAGGRVNGAFGAGATVAGGEANVASGGDATVGGGGQNTASGLSATVAGGDVNIASGIRAVVPGGTRNQAGGERSFAAGTQAKVRNAAQSGDANGDEGTFVWADSTAADFTSTGPNQFLVRAGGGVAINTNTPATGAALTVNGNIEGTRVDGSSNSPGSIGIAGYNGAGGVGVMGIARNSATSSGIGVWGESQDGLGYAGFFVGNVRVVGTLQKNAGSFKIDHPLDPRNKYLLHSFVESPDMKNIYDGVVTTDADGFATVVLPRWFQALNRDFRYQLTVIDDSDDWVMAKVVREVARRRFTLRTSRGNVKVSWQLTGIRKDAYAQSHRIPVEEVKPENERGRCLTAEACGERN